MSITVADLVDKGDVCLVDLRRLWQRVYPDRAGHGTLELDDIISYNVVLSALIVRHLLNRKVVDEQTAYDIVSALREDVTRYAEDVEEFIDGSEKLGKRRNVVPAMCLEVMGGRFVRLGLDSAPYDLHEQKEITYEELAHETVTCSWSYAVFPLGLYLEAFPLKFESTNANRITEKTGTPS